MDYYTPKKHSSKYTLQYPCLSQDSYYYPSNKSKAQPSTNPRKLIKNINTEKAEAYIKDHGNAIGTW